MKRIKIITQTVLALLFVSFIVWIGILRNENKALKSDIEQLKIDYNISLDSLINEIRIKDSIVNDIEGIVKDKKDCHRFKRIYNKAK